jgi:hypothetical protein
MDGFSTIATYTMAEREALTRELSEAVGRVREEGRDPSWSEKDAGISAEAAKELAEYLEEGERSLGAIPTPTRVVAERFFDESGGMQLVIHAPFGGRINRAWGLTLRKRFCRGFGFELQAAATEEAIVLSLGPQHSFPLEEVFDYLHPDTAYDLLVQALLAAPMFGTRWRWNATRALLLPRTQMGGKRVPTPLLRMRGEDLLVDELVLASHRPHERQIRDMHLRIEMRIRYPRTVKGRLLPPITRATSAARTGGPVPSRRNSHAYSALVPKWKLRTRNSAIVAAGRIHNPTTNASPTQNSEIGIALASTGTSTSATFFAILAGR